MRTTNIDLIRFSIKTYEKSEIKLLMLDFIEQKKLVRWESPESREELIKQTKKYNKYKDQRRTLINSNYEYGYIDEKEISDEWKDRLQLLRTNENNIILPTIDMIDKDYKSKLNKNDIDINRNITNIYKLEGKKSIGIILNTTKSKEKKEFEYEKDGELMKYIKMIDVYHNSFKIIGMKKYNKLDNIKYNLLYILLLFLHKRNYTPLLRHIDIALDIKLKKDDIFIAAPHNKNPDKYTDYKELKNIHSLYQKINDDKRYDILHNKEYIRKLAEASDIVILEKIDIFDKLIEIDKYIIKIEDEYKRLNKKFKMILMDPVLFYIEKTQEPDNEYEIKSIHDNIFIYEVLGLEKKEKRDIKDYIDIQNKMEVIKRKKEKNSLDKEEYKILLAQSKDYEDKLFFILKILSEYKKNDYEKKYKQPILINKIDELLKNAKGNLIQEKAITLRYKSYTQRSYYYNKTRKENLSITDNEILMRFETSIKIDNSKEVRKQIQDRLNIYSILSIDSDVYSRKLKNKNKNFIDRIDMLRYKKNHSDMLLEKKKTYEKNLKNKDDIKYKRETRRKIKDKILKKEQYKYGNIIYDSDIKLLKQEIKYKTYSHNLDKIDYILNMFHHKIEYTNIELDDMLSEWTKIEEEKEKKYTNISTKKKKKKKKKKDNLTFLEPKDKKTYVPKAKDKVIIEIFNMLGIKNLHEIYKINIKEVAKELIKKLENYKKISKNETINIIINKLIKYLNEDNLEFLEPKNKKTYVPKAKDKIIIKILNILGIKNLYVIYNMNIKEIIEKLENYKEINKNYNKNNMIQEKTINKIIFRLKNETKNEIRLTSNDIFRYKAKQKDKTIVNILKDMGIKGNSSLYAEDIILTMDIKYIIKQLEQYRDNYKNKIVRNNTINRIIIRLNEEYQDKQILRDKVKIEFSLDDNIKIKYIMKKIDLRYEPNNKTIVNIKDIIKKLNHQANLSYYLDESSYHYYKIIKQISLLKKVYRDQINIRIKKNLNRYSKIILHNKRFLTKEKPIVSYIIKANKLIKHLKLRNKRDDIIIKLFNNIISYKKILTNSELNIIDLQNIMDLSKERILKEILISIIYYKDKIVKLKPFEIHEILNKNKENLYKQYPAVTIDKLINRFKVLKENRIITHNSKVKKIKNQRKISYDIKTYEHRVVIKLRQHNITMQNTMFNELSSQRKLYLEVDNKNEMYNSIYDFIDCNYDSDLSQHEIYEIIYIPLEEFYKIIKQHRTPGEEQQKENNILSDVELKEIRNILK